MIANLWSGNSYYHRPITPTGIPFGRPKLWKTHLDEGTFYFWMSKTLMHPASPVRSISPSFNSTPDTCCNPLDKLEQRSAQSSIDQSCLPSISRVIIACIKWFRSPLHGIASQTHASRYALLQQRAGVVARFRSLDEMAAPRSAGHPHQRPPW